jgi:hypothetical protein
VAKEKGFKKNWHLEFFFLLLEVSLHKDQMCQFGQLSLGLFEPSDELVDGVDESLGMLHGRVQALLILLELMLKFFFY